MVVVLEKENNLLKSLNTISRKFSCSTRKLQIIHEKIGIILGNLILSEYPINELEIKNAQNKKFSGFSQQHTNITLITLLRSGLYLSLGIQKNLFGNYTHLLSYNSLDIETYFKYIINKDIILVDAVINSGKTIEEYLKKLSDSKTICIASLVMHSYFVKKYEKCHKYKFYTSRVSNNYYIGKGANDTGNRLFGTKMDSFV